MNAPKLQNYMLELHFLGQEKTLGQEFKFFY